VQQHIGMPFIIMQQVQPGIIIDSMQSQQAWIIFAMAGSLLVQVMVTPMSVISIRQVPIVMLQQHAGMPFIIMQHEHIPPAIMLQRFWSIMALVRSSQTHIIRMPPSIFSTVMVQRGAIIMPMPAPMPIGMFVPMPIGMPIDMGIPPPIIEGIPLIIPIMPMGIMAMPPMPMPLVSAAPRFFIPRSLVIVFMAIS
jgi:hypothetical protein